MMNLPVLTWSAPPLNSGLVYFIPVSSRLCHSKIVSFRVFDITCLF